MFSIKLDICAPEVEVCVLNIHHALNDQYCIVDGTSFTCPLVAAKTVLIKRKLTKFLHDVWCNLLLVFSNISLSLQRIL